MRHPPEIGRLHHQPAIQEVLLDPGIPAVRLFGLQGEVPVFAVELVQRRGLEALAEAGAQDGVSTVQAPGRRSLASDVTAHIGLIIVAHPPGQGQTGQHLAGDLAVAAVDGVMPPIGRELEGGRERIEARPLALGAEHRLIVRGDLEAAFIFDGVGATRRHKRGGCGDAEVRGLVRVLIVVIDGAVFKGQPVLQPAVEQREVQPRIVDQLLCGSVLVVVAEGESGRVVAVKVGATARIVDTLVQLQIGRQVVGEPPREAVGVKGAWPAPAKRLVEARNALGCVIIGGQPPDHRAVLAAKGAAEIARSVAAHLGLQVALQRLGGPRGDDVDHPADRLAAVERGLRAAQHFDAGDVAADQVGEVVAGARIGRVVDLHPIDQSNGLVGVRAADEHRGGFTRTAIATDAEPGRAIQDIGDAGFLVQLDLGLGQHGE